MFASEVVRGWEIAWLQIADRARGDRLPRFVGENSFYRNQRADQACGFFRALRKAGAFMFPRDDELTIEKRYMDILMAFCCIQRNEPDSPNLPDNFFGVIIL